MVAKYRDDHGLGDMIVGEASGVAYNFSSWFGASTRPAPPGQQSGPKRAEVGDCEGMSPILDIGKFTFDETSAIKPRTPPHEPSGFEKLLQKLSVGPFIWACECFALLRKSKVWMPTVLACALLGALSVSMLGWGSGSMSAQIALIVLGFAGGAMVPYGTLLICAGILAAYAFLVLGVLWLGMVAAGLLIAAGALAGAGGAIYGLFVLVAAM